MNNRDRRDDTGDDNEPSARLPPRDRRRRSLVIIAVITLVAAVAIFSWIRGRDDSDTHQTARVEAATGATWIETTGTLQPADRRTLVVAVSGSVELVAVQPGDRVQIGDILIALDREPYDRALGSVERTLEGAEIALSAATLTRETDGDQSVDEILAAGEAREAVARAELARDQAQRERDATQLRASADGVVLSVDVSEGQLISAGTPTLTLMIGDALHVQTAIDEVDVSSVPAGTDVVVTFDALPAQTIDGVIARVSPVGVQQGGGIIFDATVTLLSDDLEIFNDLRPGMSARVRMTPPVERHRFVVPESAIMVDDGVTQVVVLRDGDEVPVPVTVDRPVGGDVVIESDNLQDGDVVVLQP